MNSTELDAAGSSDALCPAVANLDTPKSDSAGIGVDDPRVVLALDDYSAAVRAGRVPDRIEFQSRYPEVAEALAECLEGLDFVRAAAGQLKHPAAGQLPGGAASLAEFWPADALGDYRIVRELGRGGMGVVYEVVQVSLGRRVALKVLPFAAALDAKQLQRFKNEAQAAAQLHHQNIVPVYGVGCERGVHYYAMQFIDGQTLAALIGELGRLAMPGRNDPPVSSLETATLAGELVSGHWMPAPRGGELEATALFRAPVDSTEALRVPEGNGSSTAANTQAIATASTERSTKSPAFFRTVANLGMQAAAALEHAHAQGVVHRDIKPANLLIDSRGNLWITDFGLAHCQNQAELTKTGDLMGTLRYMSPEQTLAHRVLLDHRTDIYSLGATLYELLTLRPVFDGCDRQELMRQIALEEPRPPRSINTAIPAELETIVLKAMEKKPAERYATAQHLADDLQRYLKDEPIRAMPPTLTHKLKKWVRRHIGVVRTALVMLVLLLVAVAAVASLAAWRLNNQRTVTRNQLRLTQEAEAEATLRLYRSLLGQARANRLTRRMGQRFKTLDILAEAIQHARAMDLPEQDMLELRNEAIACLALPDLRAAKEWDGWPTGSMTLDFDDGLKRYARVDRQGMVSVRRVADDDELWRLSAFGPGDYGPGNETLPRLSPDGRCLLLVRGERLKVWDLSESLPVVSIELSGITTGAFSPDSRRLAVGRTDGSVDLHDLSARSIARQVAVGSRTEEMVFHPDGRRLAMRCGAGIQVYDLENGSLVTTLSESAGAMDLAWDPDGKSLAGATRTTVRIWDMTSGQPIIQLQGHKTGGVRPAFNHAGDLLVTSCSDGILRVWDPRTGRLVFNTNAAAYPVRFSLNDHLLGIGIKDQKLQFWEVAPTCGYRTLVRDGALGRSEYHACSVSRKHPLLAVGMSDGVAFWHSITGELLAFLPLAGYRHLIFEPSGALLTQGPSGLMRWPIRDDVKNSGLLTVGPPQSFPVPGSDAQIASSLDGLVVGSAQRHGGLVVRLDRPDQPVPLAPHDDVRYVAVSPDGRWVATGSHWGTKVKIWDARNGKPVHELPIENSSTVAFSPDGKWLVTTGAGGQVWANDTWRLVRDFGGFGIVAFSPDGKLLAAHTGDGRIRLADPATGREYASLEDPNQDPADWLCFSADGAQIVTTSFFGQSIHVWDLRAIRDELAQMNLDWNLPAYPPVSADDQRPLQIEVNQGPPAQE